MRTIRARLTMVIAAAVALSVALVSAILYYGVRAELRDQIDQSLREGTRLLPAVEERPPVDATRGDVVTIAPDSIGGVRAFVQTVPVAGREGLVVPAPRESTLPIDARDRAVAAGKKRAFFRDAEIDGTHVRIYTAPVRPGLAVQLARSLEEVDDTLARLRPFMLAVSLGGIVLAAALGLLVAGSALRPIARLAQTAEDVADTHDLSRRIRLNSQDELARLAGSFNTMLAALEASVTAQQRLIADASHELRTPITSVRTNIEVLAADEEISASERKRLLADVVRELEELSTLLDNLVELARDPQVEDEVTAFRLDSVVEDAVQRARFHAPQVEFDVRSSPSVVKGSPWRVERAVRNLLDNARKWSPPGAIVEVVVGDARVTVRDRGPGVSDDDAPRIFDRFYRSPAARGVPGSGLGLAIVRQVADDHGGSVRVEKAEGGGSRFILDLDFNSGDRHMRRRPTTPSASN